MSGRKYRYQLTNSLSDLEEAISSWEQVWHALQKTFVVSSIVYKLGQQDAWSDLDTRLTLALIQWATVHSPVATAAYCRAMEVVEGSKSRLLTELLGRGDLPAPLTMPIDQVTREQALLSELTDMDTVVLSLHDRPGIFDEEPSPVERMQRRNRLLADLNDVWTLMVQQTPEAADYVALRRGGPPSWRVLAQLATELGTKVAFLSMFTTADEIILFVMRCGWKKPEVTCIPLTAQTLQYEYYANYEDEMLNRHLWLAERPFTCHWRDLGIRLLGPVMSLFEGVDHLVIIPHGSLHRLPLHALRLNTHEETLLDHCSVSYIPALSCLTSLLKKSCCREGNALVLGYTSASSETKNGQQERALFLGEAEKVAKQIGVSPYLDSTATSYQLASLMQAPLRLIHLSCHGYSNPSNPLDSGIRLADGDLSVRQWMGLHLNADLVTLSACQVGTSHNLAGDEMAGFAQALLLAGGHAALLGLWTVNAWTTATLMEKFYQRALGNEGQWNKAAALREASLALRDGHSPSQIEEVDLTDPYYWAPFVLYGDWR